MTHDHPLWQLLDGLQMDIRAANAKLTTLRSEIAALNLTPTTTAGFECPVDYCTVTHALEWQIRDHLANVHWWEPDQIEAIYGAAADQAARAQSLPREGGNDG